MRSSGPLSVIAGELAAELSRLKDGSGLSFARLAAKTNCSKSSLERYLNGKLPPPRHAVEAISDVCGGDTERLVRLWRLADLPPMSPASAGPLGTRHRPSSAGPSQLPPDIADFTGFERETAALCEHLVGRRAASGGIALPVAMIFGRGGSGKTTLAAHAAHQLAEAFPDGRLLFHLRGAEHRPVSPADLLGRALLALGAPATPAALGIDEQIERYRLATAERNVLVVLDDAVSAEQVRPLLPGNPQCAVIITCRALLTSVPGALRIGLTSMSERHCRTLLSRIVGCDRVEAEPDAAAELVRLCGGLPLAVRTVGARLALKGHWPLRRLAQRLSDERRRLDELAIGDLEVRASLAVSYAGLEPAARRAFRLLGYLDAPELPAWMAAALLGQGMGDASDAAMDPVEDLVDMQLLDVADVSDGVVRYRVHDLVRLYARELAELEDAPTDLRAALTRAFDTCLMLLERSTVYQRFFMPRLYGATPPGRDFDDEPPALALEWDDRSFERDEVALVAAVQRSAPLGMHEHACALAEALVFASFGHPDSVFFTSYLTRHQFDGWEGTYRVALEAAHAAGDLAGEAAMECGLGFMHVMVDTYTDAARRFRRALDLFTVLGDDRGRAVALGALASTHREVGRPAEAIATAQEAHGIFARLGEREQQAQAQYVLGGSHRDLGHDEEALRCLHAAARGYAELDNDRGKALAYRGIGQVHRARGEWNQAVHHCARAHDIACTVDDRLTGCYTAQALGKALIRQGDLTQAAPLLHAALAGCADASDRFGVALLHRTLGEFHLVGGEPAKAHRYLGQALGGWAELDLAMWRARTLRDLGAAHILSGAHDQAHAAWQDALEIFRGLGLREAAQMEAWRRFWGCHCHRQSA